jgi:hypothetical protein
VHFCFCCCIFGSHVGEGYTRANPSCFDITNTHPGILLMNPNAIIESPHRTLLCPSFLHVVFGLVLRGKHLFVITLSDLVYTYTDLWMIAQRLNYHGMKTYIYVYIPPPQHRPLHVSTHSPLIIDQTNNNARYLCTFPRFPSMCENSMSTRFTNYNVYAMYNIVLQHPMLKAAPYFTPLCQTYRTLLFHSSISAPTSTAQSSSGSPTTRDPSS